MSVAYLGPAGTFSEEAARADGRAGDRALLPYPTIAETLRAVVDGAAQTAVVPIENAIEGSVAQTYDTLAELDGLVIVAEQIQPVAHQLIGPAEVSLDRLRRVVSHPQPLGQCATWLRTQCPDAVLVAASSTAEAVRTVLETADVTVAAIGTARAAQLYGGTVLAAGIEDEPGNETRFVWVTRATDAPATPTAEQAKTTLTFWGPGDDSPGWLVRCLSEFASRGVNLSKIESRPLRTQLGHYRFFVDLSRAVDDTAAAEAIAALRGHCEYVRILGSYAAARHAEAIEPA